MVSQKSVVITGVSTGIGAATAKVLVDSGFHVFGSLRSKADAKRLSGALGDNFTPLIFDVTDVEAMQKAAGQVDKALDGQKLAGLVNNAGIAIGAPILHQSLDEFRAHIDVNIMGVVAATQIFAPLLGTDPARKGTPGRIVNIGSIAGRHAFPFMAAYHTTKYGLEGLTESMRRELMLFGIDAIIVAPGSVVSQIWTKAEGAGPQQYADTPYRDILTRMIETVRKTGEAGMPAERIGRTILEALTHRRPKTYYRVTHSELEFHALTKLPKRFVDRLIGKRIGLIK